MTADRNLFYPGKNSANNMDHPFNNEGFSKKLTDR